MPKPSPSTDPENTALARAILASKPEDRPDLSGLIQAQDLDPTQARPALVIEAPPIEPPPAQELDQEQGQELEPPELITLEAWQEQWGFLHDFAGGMVAMRTDAPCPLGDQARSPGGKVAAQAVYDLCSTNPTLARLILSPGSSYLAAVAAIGAHGVACVRIVRASQLAAQPQGEAA